MQLSKIINTEHPSDRILIVFVFLPLLRHEIDTYVRIHNAHHIRVQEKREHHVPGIPNELYFGKDYILKEGFDKARATRGFRPNLRLLRQHIQLFEQYGMLYKASALRKLTNTWLRRGCSLRA
jgi:hypothetical protein